MSAPRQAGDWWKAARQQIDTLDARLLLHTVTGISHAALLSHPETLLTPAEQERLAHLTQRRAAGEPLAYLTNEAGFYGRNFAVAAGQVLIPRPETEELVDRALTLLAQLAAAQTPNILKALDLGTGSGVIPVSLALEYRGSIPLAMTAAEISPAALAIARQNGMALNADVRWLESDWFSALKDERFHLITANPPYIAADDPHLAVLRYEPRAALTDEADGLTCIRAITAAAPAHLEAGGWLLFEHGWNQGKAGRDLLAAAGFTAVQTWQDLSGHERFSAGKMPVC